MLKNFVTITIRNLARNWNYTLINVTGLSVGIAACMVIYLVVNFEISFDTAHSNYSQIYRVTRISTSASGEEFSSVTPYPFIEAFRNDFSDVPLATQMHSHESAQVTIGDEKYKVDNILFADSLFFQVFDFGVVSGNPALELGTPGKVFLTQSLYDKIVKNSVTHLKLDNKLELEIAGIVKDPPPASHIQYTMVVSMPSLSKEFIGLSLDQWGMNMSGFSYVSLPNNISAQSIDVRFKNFVDKYYQDSESHKPEYNLQPLCNVHFDERFSDTAGGPSFVNKYNLVVLSFLGGFILLVACINFINLSTALAVKKSKEIGVRKTLGASRQQLVVQYLSEAFLLTVLSTILALIIVETLLPMVSSFLQKELTLSLENEHLPLFIAGVILITSLLSGLYPAFVLSNFNPATVLKNKLTHKGSSGEYARKYLVVFQFLIAQLLIIGTLVVAGQMKFLNSKPLGFTKEAIVNVVIPENLKEKREAFQNLLEVIPGVESYSFSLGAPVSENNFGTGYYLTDNGAKEQFDTRIKLVDKNYLDTYDLTLVSGRWFTESEEKAVDSSIPNEEKKYVYIVNETLVKQLGFRTPEEIIGKNITTGLNDITAPVVGVVKDFHTSSLHHAVEPVVIVQFPYFYYDAGIRINTNNTAGVMAAIEEAYEKVFPEFLFDYTFFDSHLESLYGQEQRNFRLIQVFAGLSILISCLGLYGLISFLTQQKKKEVSIRKVFGASVGSIVILFSKKFASIIAIAFAIATPIAWFTMNSWLNEFAYHITMGTSFFIIALVSTMCIALLTVAYQSIRSAIANPTQSLRNE